MYFMPRLLTDGRTSLWNLSLSSSSKCKTSMTMLRSSQTDHTSCFPECTGTSVLQVTATDADDPTYGNSARVVYSILQGQPYFSVDPKTGVIRTALHNMDREAREHYSVVIQAKDMAGQVGGLSGSTTVNITLTDVNDNPPRFQNTINCMFLSLLKLVQLLEKSRQMMQTRAQMQI
ncbi:cadherin 18, type 2 (predicted) [Rattus norvegicus]|uniref:Cadherin 18, type 2 (Predicted) n=1 Tax=Rattus norvegicus TaxID=10116 RepID=A6JMV4_RAT|nr:cadherin 18, type 2 (predicted) [Rattus norvegicus]